MGSITVHIEGSPEDVAAFIKNFQPALIENQQRVVPSEVYLTKDAVEAEAPKPTVYTKEMVMGALKHYGMRLQQTKGTANTATFVKGLIHSVVGDGYTGAFDSVDSRFYEELYAKAQSTETFGEWS